VRVREASKPCRAGSSELAIMNMSGTEQPADGAQHSESNATSCAAILRDCQARSSASMGATGPGEPGRLRLSSSHHIFICERAHTYNVCVRACVRACVRILTIYMYGHVSVRLCHRSVARVAAGFNWTLVIAKAPWNARFGHTAVVDAAGAIYVLGGKDSKSILYKDVWVSSDGGADRTRGYSGVLDGVL
jgi:hypothetical protein